MMKIQIHRPQNLFGETLIEISTAKTKILLDCGTNAEDNALPATCEDLNIADFSAVFLAHSHTDYVGLVGNNIYLSKLAGKIITAASTYQMRKVPAFAGYYQNRVPITVGDITVTPVLVDRDDYDAYLFLIQGEGKCVLYAGDYRATGRKSFEEMLQNLPNKVDALLCEGLGLTSEDISLITERDLEEQITEVVSSKTGPIFVLQSVTDLDRTNTIFHAAKRNRRLFLEDLYLANISDAVGNIVPNPNGFVGVKAFLTTGYRPEHIRYRLFEKLNRVDKSQLSSQKFVMCIRTNMKKFMKSLSQSVRFYDGALIVSLPAGERAQAAEFAQFAQSKGLEIKNLHTSGHADARALQALVSAVHPAKIVPVQLENANWFIGEFSANEVIKEDSINL
ncbi:MAG TPA: MBL fold metallo-hydrolase [Oscillospiraceae bacterium]|nr:MBL fold metallo-hydrolase [Oscillospiraceae bacterium]